MKRVKNAQASKEMDDFLLAYCENVYQGAEDICLEKIEYILQCSICL